MNGLPYYKAYPRDFLEGTIGMPFEVKCAYRVLLDIIYMQGGRLPDDARYISGLLGCSVRKWKSIRAALLDAGKITAENEIISNFRADNELETSRKFQDKQAENRGRPNKTKDLPEPKADHTEPEPYKSPNGDNARARRGQPNRFQEFWEAYPDRSGSNPRKPAEKKFIAAVKAGTDPDTIIAGAKAYAAASRADGSFGTPYVAQAQTWLNQARWEQYAGTAPKPATPDEIERHNREAAEREAYWLARIAEDRPDGSAEGSPGIGVGEGSSNVDAGELGQGEGGELQPGAVGEQRGRVRSFQGPDDNDIRRRCEDAADGGQPAMGRMVSVPPDGGAEELRVRGALQPVSRSVGAILACASGIPPDWEQ